MKKEDLQIGAMFTTTGKDRWKFIGCVPYHSIVCNKYFLQFTFYSKKTNTFYQIVGVNKKLKRISKIKKNKPPIDVSTAMFPFIDRDYQTRYEKVNITFPGYIICRSIGASEGAKEDGLK